MIRENLNKNLHISAVLLTMYDGARSYPSRFPTR